MIANSPRLINIPIVLGLIAVLVFVSVDEELPLWLRNDYETLGPEESFISEDGIEDDCPLLLLLST